MLQRQIHTDLFFFIQLLPTNRDLLHLLQERNWIPLLLGWLNLHDRPAVQVEALLTLTNIAELCAQQTYYSGSSASTAAASSAQAVATAAAKLTEPNLSQGSISTPTPVPPFYSFPPPDSAASSSNSNSSSYSYPALVPPTPGSVPFPPLSFSQTLSPEALAAFDASLLSTIQQSRGKGSNTNPSLGSAHDSVSISSTLATRSALPFPSSSSSTHSFLPPPTPVSNQDVGSTSFPQQLSASSQHLLLRHADAIPTLISLLASPSREVYEQAMWILGSIASGDSTGTSSSNSSSNSSDSGRDKSVAARDVILAAGVMKQMLRCLESHPTNLSLQRIGSWTLSNLVEGIFQQPSHGKSGAKSEYSSSDEIEMHVLLPVLRRLLRMSDAEVLSYTCWTLSHLCDGPSSHISAVVTSRDPKAPRGGLVPRLVELLGHSSWRVTKPALRTIGNIVCAECSDDGNQSASAPTDYTEVILDCCAVPKLKELVTHSNREIQKEACWTLSNIAAGTVDQIQAVIDSGAIPPLVKLVSNKGTDQEVRSEACWVVLNATSCGSDSQIEVLVDEGCVSVLGVLLSEASMVMMALEGLERVLQVEEAREMTRRESADCDEDESTPTLVSASLIEKALDKHNSSAVTKRAGRIWKQHFVSCALCHKSFSKHRTCDATFCEECKCYVCSNCDCQIYHLSYQEELWAATEEQTEAKKNAKKSKKAKKKEKQKQKKASQPHQVHFEDISRARSPLDLHEGGTVRSRWSTVNSVDDNSAGDSNLIANTREIFDTGPTALDHMQGRKSTGRPSPISSDVEDDDRDIQEEDDDPEQAQAPIDFVLYLQQTGSIIALAKLMDALDYGEGEGQTDDLNDTELQMLRHHVLNYSATN
jgi:importin subunit alpha-6/7